MRRSRFLLIAAITLGATAPLQAAAQGPSPDSLEEARNAYNEGTEAEKAGDCKRAIERFEAAAAVKESPAVRLRIGRCREKLGLWKAALSDYERAQKLAEADPAAKEVAVQLAAELSNRLPRLKILVADPPSDLVVTLDGEPVGASGAPERADPGKRVLVAKAAGKQPFETSFELADGEVKTLTITLVAASAPPPLPPPPPAAAPEAPFPWLPVGLYAGGGLALGIGVPLLLVSLGADADLDAKCFEADGAPSADRDPCLKEDGTDYSSAEQQTIADDRDAINTQQIVGWVLVAAGAAAGGVATVLLLTGADDEASQAGIERVAPIAGPGLAGLTVAGRF